MDLYHSRPLPQDVVPFSLSYKGSTFGLLMIWVPWKLQVSAFLLCPSLAIFASQEFPVRKERSGLSTLGLRRCSFAWAKVYICESYYIVLGLQTVRLVGGGDIEWAVFIAEAFAANLVLPTPMPAQGQFILPF